MTLIHPDSVGDPTPEAVLERHANAIKALGKRAAKDMIEIGYHLTQAKLLCGHGHWLRWLDSNFGMTERTARNIMQVAAGFGFQSEAVSDLNLSFKILCLLTRPSTDPEVRQVVIERAARGELVSHREVKTLIDQAAGKPSKPDKQGAEQLHEQLIANSEPSSPPFNHNAPTPNEWDGPLGLMTLELQVDTDADEIMKLVKRNIEALGTVLHQVEPGKRFRIMSRYSEIKAAVQALLDLVRP
jgi:hypothetical protein